MPLVSYLLTCKLNVLASTCGYSTATKQVTCYLLSLPPPPPPPPPPITFNLRVGLMGKACLALGTLNTSPPTCPSVFICLSVLFVSLSVVPSLSPHLSLPQELDEVSIAHLIKESNVLQTKEYTKWNWGLLFSFLQHPSLRTTQINEDAFFARYILCNVHR